ncbi:MAG: hypothetical protein Q9207_005009 [Kuettlingeria erythrocarpa]
MLLSHPNILLLIILTFQLHTSAHALPPAAAPPAREIATHPLNASKRTKEAPPIVGNCHGSLWCSLYGGHFISTAYQLATNGYPPPGGTTNNPGPLGGWNTAPMNDTAFYAEGAHAICIPIPGTFSPGGGFCVFAEDPTPRGGRGGGGGGGGGGDRPGVTGMMVKAALRELLEMGCRMCGAVGSGGQDWGWVAADYVSGPVCEGVCPEARYEAVGAPDTAVGISLAAAA